MSDTQSHKAWSIGNWLTVVIIGTTLFIYQQNNHAEQMKQNKQEYEEFKKTVTETKQEMDDHEKEDDRIHLSVENRMQQYDKALLLVSQNEGQHNR